MKSKATNLRRNAQRPGRITSHTRKLLLAACCLLLLFRGYAQKEVPAEKVKLSVTNVTLSQVLDALDKQSVYSFTYVKEDFDKIIIRDYKADNISLNDALHLLKKKTGIEFAINSSSIIFRKIMVSADPARKGTGKITGKILDEENALPVSGATITIGGHGITADADGEYVIMLPSGNYSAEISSVGYGKKQVTDIEVSDNTSSSLNITLKRDKGNMAGVVVKASARKEGVAALFLAQKNRSNISDGISSEQISRTPDKNVGESLKRITGVSTIDNKFVVVRGIGERYNSVTMDGTILPSTEANVRTFSFDLIPNNMVDNIVVSKTITPDMNVNFGGGLVQIITKDIPKENFAGIVAGGSYNDQSTGKDFLSHKRGKTDYWGFDDGRRKFPTGLVHTNRSTAPLNNIPDAEYNKIVEDQSKRFKNDNFTLYKYKTAPSQNYQFTLGRLFKLDTAGNRKFGFTGSLSYRNTQNIDIIEQQRRSDWNSGFIDSTYINTGKAYSFNTTLGGLFNAGLQLGNHRFSFRNTYTHMYDNVLVRTMGWSDDVSDPSIKAPQRIIEADDPTYNDLFQNKLAGIHQLGKLKIEWDVARTSINRQEKDLGIAISGVKLINNKPTYFYYPGIASEPRQEPLSRQHYANEERHHSWNVSASIPFRIGKLNSTVKTGYFGIVKKAVFDWDIAALTLGSNFPESYGLVSISDMLKPENIGANSYFYSVSPWWKDGYEGKSKSHAGYLMMDNRLFDKIRLVWGVRGDYYEYTEVKNGNNQKIKVFEPKSNPKMRWLPSANLTYSPTGNVNLRAAYSKTVIRPELMENSQFWKYSPFLGAMFGNGGIFSTGIKSYDFKAEWFPGAGEIVSAGAFFKRFDNPAEMVLNAGYAGGVYYLQSSDWAKVSGLEFEVRKNFGFIANSRVLKNLTAYGNLTLTKSEVRTIFKGVNPNGGEDLTFPSKETRPLYGQAPYLVNAGLQYSGEHLGFNAMYNKTGYKTYIVSNDVTRGEFEKPREQVDAQVSYRMFKKKLEIKVNAGNLFNAISVFYSNTNSYIPNPDAISDGDYSDSWLMKPGYSNKFDEGDLVKFAKRSGRTFSASLNYNF